MKTYSLIAAVLAVLLILLLFYRVLDLGPRVFDQIDTQESLEESEPVNHDSVTQSVHISKDSVVQSVEILD